MTADRRGQHEAQGRSAHGAQAADRLDFDVSGQLCPSTLLTALKVVNECRGELRNGTVSLRFKTDNRDALTTIPDAVALMGYQVSVRKEDGHYFIDVGSGPCRPAEGDLLIAAACSQGSRSGGGGDAAPRRIARARRVMHMKTRRHPLALAEDWTAGPDAWRDRHAALVQYLRDKVNQLLRVVGTWPLQAEHLDDESLVALDPIGIIADSFSQILVHLRETNEDLSLAHDQIRTLINEAPVGILLIDAKTHGVMEANASALKTLGHSREALLGRPCHRFVCPAEEGRCPITDCGQSCDNSQRVLIRSDGREIPVLKTVNPVSIRGRRHLLESFIDISERVAAEQALKKSEERYRSLYSTMREGVALHELILGEDGAPEDFRIVDVNASYERILGLSRDEVLGMAGSRIYGRGEPPYLERFAAVVQTGEPSSFEAVFRQRHFSVSAVRTEPGRFATIFDDITARKQAEQRVKQLAYFDTLTGLPNRSLLLDPLKQSLLRCAREGSRLAVLFLDLDRFKTINDSLGHSTGDRLLQSVAARLQGCVRASDTVARFGGDEFVVLLEGIKQDLDATRVAKGMLAECGMPFQCNGHEVFTSLSVGIALYPADGESGEELLKSADMAMYAAKEWGRNTYRFYSLEMNQVAQERRALENALRRALRQQEFSVVYQPQVNLAQGRVTGLEALVRWINPEQGEVLPGRFIPVCEESGLILPLSDWLLAEVCQQRRAWMDLGLSPIRVAVNLSSVQFQRADLVRSIRAVLDRVGVDPGDIEIELTESMMMDDAETTIQTLNHLKETGLRLAIDDFGTGYSSLSYLSSFPIDRVKIAQRFVRNLPDNAQDAAIVEAIIAIARSLGIEVIAEGVETAAQLEFLRSRGCTEVQGYYFSRPVRSESVGAHLREWLRPEPVCPIGVR